MSRVFISYPDEDKWLTESIQKFLKLMNTECLIAEKDKRPGKYLFLKILELIIKSTCVLVLYTMNAPHSEWVDIEIKIAKLLKKDLIPVVEAGMKDSLPEALGEEREYIHFIRSNPLSAIEEICSNIKNRQEGLTETNSHA